MNSATTDANFGPIWAAPDPALSTLTGGRDQDESSSSSILTMSGPEMGGETNARRQMYPKEQWLAVKSIIQRLYIDEGQKFLQVAEYLDQNHSFKPTKKQFLTRVKEWGFQKNVKQGERRAILESLGDVVSMGDFEARKLRGRRLDKAKIERWRKREALEKQDGVMRPSVTLNGPSIGDKGHSFHVGSIPMKPCNGEHFEAGLYSNEFQPKSMALDQRLPFNPWLAVDVINSPHLTGLIGALTLLEVCDDISDLDLSAPYSEGAETERDFNDEDEGGWINTSQESYALQPSVNKTHPSNSFVLHDLTIRSAAKFHTRMLGPLDELSPFPRSRRWGEREMCLKYPRTDHLILASSLKRKELKCNIKLKTLKSMERPGIIDLVENMRCIAHRHFQLDHIRLAETWWRRVITCSLGIPGYQPVKVLYACLWVVSSIRFQGRLSEARSLHRDVHQKILNLVGPEHELAIFSNNTKASLHNNYGEYDLELQTYRELIQTSLPHFGARHTLTLEILTSLGWALIACSQCGDAETILRIRLGLGGFVSSHDDYYTVLESLTAMANLATCLNDQRKYTDSAAVLAMSDSAKRQLKDLAAGNETFFGCDLQKSELFRAQGMLAESEEILRTMLKHAPDHPDIDMRNGMQQLADLLIEMNRRTEAVTWMEKMLLMDRKMYLDVYREYLWTAWELGDCYAELGRFEDTIALHKQIERQVALSQWGDPNSRSKDIERVRGWIDRVEMMRREAEMQGPETSTISQGEGDDELAGDELTAWNLEDPSMIGI